MSIPLLATSIHFICCHAGPADHFATFAEDLQSKGHCVEIYATGPALTKFENRNIFPLHPFLIEDGVEALVEKCKEAEVVLTDVGHVFDVSLQEAFKRKVPQIKRLAYYDNPEPYVPGGYSRVACQVMAHAQKVLFSNVHLAEQAIYSEPLQEFALPLEKRVAIGYYPISSAEKTAQRRREEKVFFRKEFLSRFSIVDQGQKLIVYSGGNNEEYFGKAFPAFLDFIEKISEKEDFSKFIFLLQQHPGAKEKNLDGLMLSSFLERQKERKSSFPIPSILVPDYSLDDAQVLADAILYYQTSAAPQFVLAGIATLQVGHNTFEDLLIKNGVASSLTAPETFAKSLISLEVNSEECSIERVYDALGVRKDWSDRLIKNL